MILEGKTCGRQTTLRCRLRHCVSSIGECVYPSNEEDGRLQDECECGEEETRRRLDIRAKDPNAVSDADWKIYQQQKLSIEYPEEFKEENFISLTTADTIQNLLHTLKKKCESIPV